MSLRHSSADRLTLVVRKRAGMKSGNLYFSGKASCHTFCGGRATRFLAWAKNVEPKPIAASKASWHRISSDGVVARRAIRLLYQRCFVAVRSNLTSRTKLVEKRRRKNTHTHIYICSHHIHIYIHMYSTPGVQDLQDLEGSEIAIFFSLCIFVKVQQTHVRKR